MSKRRSAAVLVAIGIGLGTLALSASAASASVPPPQCNYSSTSTAEGASCGSGPIPGIPYYRAYAKCTNGQSVYGAWENANSWQWSYADCANVGSTLQSGGSEWAYTK
jgi:hypothetical protein